MIKSIKGLKPSGVRFRGWILLRSRKLNVSNVELNKMRGSNVLILNVKSLLENMLVLNANCSRIEVPKLMIFSIAYLNIYPGSMQNVSKGQQIKFLPLHPMWILSAYFRKGQPPLCWEFRRQLLSNLSLGSEILYKILRLFTMWSSDSSRLFATLQGYQLSSLWYGNIEIFWN